MPARTAPDMVTAVPAPGLHPQGRGNDHCQCGSDQQQGEAAMHAMYYGEAI